MAAGSNNGRPDGAIVRMLLERQCKTHGDFDAFCLDYFPIVYRRFTSGMDRLQRTNLLLELCGPQEVLDALRRNGANSAQTSPIDAEKNAPVRDDSATQESAPEKRGSESFQQVPPWKRPRLRWLLPSLLCANLALPFLWRSVQERSWPRAKQPPWEEASADPHRVGLSDTLPALHPGCDSLSKARSQACTSAVGLYCKRLGYAGGISQEIPLGSIEAGCVRGERATASFEELARYRPSCGQATQSQTQDCVSAASQYCQQMAGMTAGFVQDTDGKLARLVCFRGYLGPVPLSVFRPTHPRCNAATLAQHPFCLSAAHIYCAARGQPDGASFAGGIFTKADGNVFEVACFSGKNTQVQLMN